MRSFIVSMVILVAILVTSFFSSRYLNNVANDMILKNQEITLAIENNDFEKAELLTEELDRYVQEKKMILSTGMDHTALTSIEVYTRELKRYVQDGIRNDALAKSAVLDTLLKELPRNYKLKIENIL